MKVPCVLFKVADTTYAVAASAVHMVDMIDQVTRVPNAPPWVDGLATVRGQVVPVVNLRRRFGFETQPFDLQSRLVVVRAGNRFLGLAVDQAREFMNLDLDVLEPPPDALRSPDNDALEGILNLDGRLILILTPARLFNIDEEPSWPTTTAAS